MTLNIEELKRLYLVDKQSLSKIARAVGTSISTVRRHLLSAGVELRTRADGIRNNPEQGSWFKGRTYKMSEKTKDLLRNAKLKHSALYAKGTRVKSTGYIEYTKGTNKGRCEHCVVMEQHLGRKLRTDEVVHHINRNRKDNRLNNLQLMTRSEHSKLHRQLQLKNQSL